jgi:hypothetical protein
VVAYRVVADRDRAPYSAAAVNARVDLKLVDIAGAQTAVDRVAGPDRLSVPTTGRQWARQVVIGQLRFGVPSNAAHDGQYALFVINNDEHRVVPDMWGGGPVGTNVAQGWDGHYSALASAHSWLRPLAMIRNGDGTASDPGAAVGFPPDTAGPVTFAAYLPADSLPVTNPRKQLTIALAYFAEGGDVYWVERLPA